MTSLLHLMKHWYMFHWWGFCNVQNCFNRNGVWKMLLTKNLPKKLYTRCVVTSWVDEEWVPRYVMGSIYTLPFCVPFLCRFLLNIALLFQYMAPSASHCSFMWLLDVVATYFPCNNYYSLAESRLFSTQLLPGSSIFIVDLFEFISHH